MNELGEAILYGDYSHVPPCYWRWEIPRICEDFLEGEHTCWEDDDEHDETCDCIYPERPMY